MDRKNSIDREISENFISLEDLDETFRTTNYQSTTSGCSPIFGKSIEYDGQDEDGDTILHLAVVGCSPKVVEDLIKKCDSDCLNATNNMKQTPLHVASMANRPEMVELLVGGGAKLDVHDWRGNTPLHVACERGSSEVAIIIIDALRMTKQDKNTLIGYLELTNFDGQSCLHLASHRNNYEIIKILLDRSVSLIPEPHDPRCNCASCCSARSEDYLKHSRSRMNAYRALASPCLMALSSRDPLLTAFQLSSKLENLVMLEPEYKKEYLNLRAQCQTFATKLLDHARTSQELETLLNYSHNEPKKSNHYTHLARLRLAIQCKQKTFCAHPNIQELLATMWYENLPGFRRRNIFAQILQVISIGVMFPLLSLAYLIAPNSRLGRYIKKPFIKFICHSASYITFLIVLILASQRVEAFYCWDRILDLFRSESNLGARIVQGSDTNGTLLFTSPDLSTLWNYYKQEFSSRLGSNPSSSARGLESLTKMFDQLPASSKRRGLLPSPIELIILVWVISLLWAEIKQLYALGMNYYKADMWNTLDSVASGFYIGTIIFRIVSYIQTNESNVEVAREHWNAYDPTLLSEGLFAAGTIFSALKLVYIFSVNPYLGPLQISLGRMIIDILRFSWIYMLVLFSFACGMNQLLWYYADLERHQCLNITNYSLAQYYSTLSTNVNSSTYEDDSSKPPVTLDDSCKTWRHFSNVFESSQTLFWATFGLVDLENFDLTGIRQYTRFWALLMFGCYCFINVVVVLNLLIAMMNLSYDKISKKSDIEWKFARTRLWMSYIDTGSTVPAPFNILPSVKSIMKFSKYLVLAIFWRRNKTSPANRTAESHHHHHHSHRDQDIIQLNNSTHGIVMRILVRRYLLNEQRPEKKPMTEAKLNRWAKLNNIS